MGIEWLAYPFLFIAIFFESFVLVTLVSKPARLARTRLPLRGIFPSVAIVVPCYNEERTVANTAASVLALAYPKEKLSLILVNDGSTDGTKAAMEQFRPNHQVTIIHKENGGKHTALNAGIAATDAEFVGCLDADSFVEPESLQHLIPCFENETVGAVTAAMSVHEPKGIFEYVQYAEYFFAIAIRHIISSINGLYVTPGPFSLYRRDIVERLGGFRYGHQVEDMEMALRLQANGYRIENAPKGRVYTKAPSTALTLLRQRTRWTSGFLRNVLYDYRGLLLNSQHGALGMLVLPLALMAIASGILMFSVILMSAGLEVAEAFATRAGIPFSYAYVPSTEALDWFYLPANFISILMVITVTAGLGLILIGKWISKTPGGLVRGIASYLLLYGLLAPLWLMRASADVAIGKRRSWR